MALNNKVTVLMPDKGVTFQKKGDARYAYYAVRTYRNEKGQPTCDRVSIGKVDDATGKLIPNRNYYEVFKKEPIAFTDTIVKCGTYGVFKEISKTIGLDKAIKASFSEHYDEIMSAAHYMLCGSSTMYLMDDWMEEHLTFNKTPMTSPAISKMFEALSDNNARTAFFKDWIKKRKEKELIAYDVTSISTYARGIEDAEWGYNRDNEELPQINYAMFYSQESQLPLYYRIYPGSINDKSHLEYMAEDTTMLDMKKAYFVMDRGFYTEDNLKYMVNEKGIRFMIPIPTSINYYGELIDKYKDKVVNNYSCLIGDGPYFGKKFEVNKYGFRMNVHIFYNPDKISAEVISFKKRLVEMENSLTKMTVAPAKNSNYCKYFNITQKENYLVFEKNEDAINKELSRMGFFIIAETIFTLETEEALDTYRCRDTIEKCFDDLKNELDLKRMHCHVDQTSSGKMFTAFIALVIRSYMQKKLKVYMREHCLSFQKIINELDRIKVIYAPAKPNGYRLLNPITKTQREILQNLGVSEDFVDCLV